MLLGHLWRLTILSLAISLVGCGNALGPSKKSNREKNSEAPPVVNDPAAGQIPGQTDGGTGTDGLDGEPECEEEATAFQLTYLEDVLPVVNKYCVGCHYPAAAAGGWVLDRHNVLNPDQLPPSEAWKKVVASIENGRMPPTDNKVPAADLSMLKKWVESGAPKQNTVSCEKPEQDAPLSLLACDESLPAKQKPRVWRITHSQWGNSTRAILGADHAEELNFSSDPALYGFDNFSEALRITILQANRYREATQRLANQILDPTRISALRDIYSPGWGTADPDGDRDRFIRNFGFHLFRRPLSDEQVALLRNVHIEGKKSSIGYKLLIEAMLQSPYFLFRRELGINGQLSQYEIAEMLSFTIWDEAPDLELLNLAKANKLSGAVVEQQISRLLSSAKAERLFTRFFGTLLNIKDVKDVSKSEAAFPNFDDQVANLMYQEFELMVRHVMTKKDAKLTALFKGLPSYTNSTLAGFHGLSSTSTNFVETAAAKRGSILTSLAFLTANSGAGDNNPFLRGKILREKLLCMPLASPPANVPPLEDTPDAGFKTRRERFAAHSNSASCAGCHRMIDDLGFSFDHFDATGGFQTQAGGLPVDTKGKFTAFFDGSTPFNDATEMSAVLADSKHLSQCISIQLFRFIRGREDAKNDGCQISDAHAQFTAKDTNLKELVRSILTNANFFKVAE